MIEGYQKQPMLLQDISEEGAAEADQEVKEQEGDEEEGESWYRNCDVTVMLLVVIWYSYGSINSVTYHW